VRYTRREADRKTRGSVLEDRQDIVRRVEKTVGELRQAPGDRQEIVRIWAGGGYTAPSVTEVGSDTKHPATGEVNAAPAAETGGIRIRLLGGFEVWCGGRAVEGFESQKVRALLGYLACHRGRVLARDHLAGLLWPERNSETSRHALRQAVYNLKSSLPPEARAPIVGSYNGVQLDPKGDVWIDVTAFEEAVRLGKSRDGIDLHHLTAAVQLYRGELFSGFFLRDCESFEEWLVAEQERLREMAVDALRSLVEHYRLRGEHRFGLHYARRLVVLEPLSEEARRDVMRLALLAGRRSFALAEYEKLRIVLRDELGVEPLEETRSLYESILREKSLPSEPTPETEVLGPLVPLVGREDALAALRESWRRSLGGRAGLVLVEGKDGIGKTRLVKSFLGTVAAEKQVLILKGRSYDLAPPMAYGPIREILSCVVAEEGQLSTLPLSKLPAEDLAELARLAPEIRELRGDLPSATPMTDTLGREPLFSAISRCFRELCEGPGGRITPLVLFLDDLHLADRSSFDLVEDLLVRLDRYPVWIVATGRPGLTLPDGNGVSRISLDPLLPYAVSEIATALVGEGKASRLVSLLEDGSAGLPLTVTERINGLWDQGSLTPKNGGWVLQEDSSLPSEDGLDTLCAARLGRLPNSVRRLAYLAAVVGPTFDTTLLAKAGEEHPAVVDIGLEILLKRWLVRRHMPWWESGGRQRDSVLWTWGARRGGFEFVHPRVRAACYRSLHPSRRQILHGQVLAALGELRSEPTGHLHELLAWHAAAAGQWDKALAWSLEAAERARALLAPDVAFRWIRQAEDALARLGDKADPGLRARLHALSG
jgi:DNA-binding SARP family transcriptional activator